jgi:hypothetical protein
MSAKFAPDAVGSKNDPNAPSQSDRKPILIVPLEGAPPSVAPQPANVSAVTMPSTA